MYQCDLGIYVRCICLYIGMTHACKVCMCVGIYTGHVRACACEQACGHGRVCMCIPLHARVHVGVDGCICISRGRCKFVCICACM